MAAPPLFDISHLDLSHTQVDAAGIEKYNKQRGAARMIDRFIHVSEDWKQAVAARRVRDDEWWCEGHIPGEPILPAVLMVEAAAQIASYLFQCREWIHYEFVGFTGIDNTKFRSVVVPGDELILLGQEVKYHPKRMICDVQGWVEDRFCFETRVTGMPVLP
ncbi:MAG: 3-hydroxyacyl-ACP dehydratase FabZ family protein [Phycisphaerales bacterium]